MEVKPGDEIEVFIERIEEPSGYIILSREKAERVIVWDDIEEAFKNGRPFRPGHRSGQGRSRPSTSGVKAFLPGLARRHQAGQESRCPGGQET